MSISVTTRRITVTPPPAPSISYPWLGSDGMRVVLFVAPGVGTVIKNDFVNGAIGTHQKSWNMNAFKEVPADEEVVIRSTH